MVHWMPCSPPRFASSSKSASTSVSCAPTHIGTRGFCGGANVGVGTGFPRASTVARTRVRRAKRSTTGYVEAPPEGMVRSTSMRFPGANSKPDAASGRAVCIPSTAITWAEGFPKSGAYTRPFEVFTRRSRTRSPGRTLSRADVCPLTVTTCPVRRGPGRGASRSSGRSRLPHPGESRRAPTLRLDCRAMALDLRRSEHRGGHVRLAPRPAHADETRTCPRLWGRSDR